MNALIRPLQPQDALYVKRLFEDTWNFTKYLSPRKAHNFAKEMAEDVIRPQYYSRGVFVGEEPVALIAGCPAGVDGNTKNTVEVLVTHPRFQKHGLASKLLAGFEDYCSQINHLPVQAISDSECQWPFYHKKNYVLMDEKPVTIGRYQGTLYIFEKLPKAHEQATADIPMMLFTAQNPIC